MHELSVLAVVSDVADWDRWSDLGSLLERDSRLRLMFCVPRQGALEEIVRRERGAVVPWAARWRFDVVLSPGDVALGRRLCLDRMLVGRGLRERYRGVLGVGDRTLVAVGSAGVEARLVGELAADRFLVVRMPAYGWRALVIASDWVIGDGEPALFAAAIGGAVSVVGDRVGWARAWDAGLPALAQLPVVDVRAVARLRASLSAAPGMAAAVARRDVYRALGLSEPRYAPVLPPLPDPVIAGVGGLVGGTP